MNNDVRRFKVTIGGESYFLVSDESEERLHAIDIKTIGDLASLTLPECINKFGKSHGNYLYRASRGIDDKPLITNWEPKSSSRETTFQRDITDWQEIARNLVVITKKVVSDLHHEGYRGRTITVKIKFSDFVQQTRGKTLLKPTDSLEIIRKSAFECLGRFDLKKKKTRLIGLRVSGLEKVATKRSAIGRI